MASLSSGWIWLAVLIVVAVPTVLALSSRAAMALLAKVSAFPDREVSISVRIRAVPWPRIEIDVKAGADCAMGVSPRST
ncbi:hypothetical protein [Amycolatopsis orientalis]|uniref:hypothetical protein n=1 Tax=Amycolatopsis orientalis TaxID=31958 RepID=UPI0003A9C165|nr:hypothetical protein [Amycolatopsis orientalis]